MKISLASNYFEASSLMDTERATKNSHSVLITGIHAFESRYSLTLLLYGLEPLNKTRERRT